MDALTSTPTIVDALGAAAATLSAWAVGLLAVRAALRSEPLPWAVRHGWALLLGTPLLGWFVLAALWAGASLHAAVVVAPGAFAGTILGFTFRARTTNAPTHPAFGAWQPAAHAAAAAMLLLFGAACFAAWHVPTLDYDGIAIWSYRTRVLLAEHTIWTPSLFNADRLIPMPRHPYLLPAMEASWCVVGRGEFTWAGSHFPHIVMLAGYLLLAWGVAQDRALGPAPRRLVLLAALALMPLPYTALSQESVREVLIGFLGLGVAQGLFAWIRHGRAGWLALAMAAAALAHSLKVEGTPLLLGALAGALLATAAAAPAERRARLTHWALAAMMAALLALPWEAVKAGLPRTAHDYDLTTGLASDWGQRLRAVPTVLRLLLTELFARPEWYGASIWLAAAWLAPGWRGSGYAVGARRLALLGPAAACAAAVCAVYVVRQAQLPPERNTTFSRRMFALVPALVLGAGAGSSFVGYRRRCRYLTRSHSAE